MNSVKEVRQKLYEKRLCCPTFVMNELERLYNEAEENGMATALLEADLLATKKQLAESDAVIRRLTYKLEEARQALGGGKDE
ncbi:hypothetical protein [Paenibacillus kribbensis]|uniref:hypothetical protein n=1 Tax=Paenibacillus kribbensis TaxID=172713 RepID=UPI0008394123|nr:hypothetical protein [Paenibacillus kribbensis]